MDAGPALQQVMIVRKKMNNRLRLDIVDLKAALFYKEPERLTMHDLLSVSEGTNI